MAKAKANKKVGAVELPECPVCLDVMSAPIFQCQSGHSLCNSCSRNLCPPICPICRQAMTQMRNWQLEDLISKATVPCPNKSIGCVYTMVAAEVEDHLKECIYREMPCPLGVIFGKCSWSGKLKEMLNHFKEHHSENCNVNVNTDINLHKVSVSVDERYVYIIPQGKFIFLVTMKIDTIQKMAYWVIQHIGSKTVARQHSYEISIISKQDERRKITFSDHCFNDALSTNEIFRIAKCAVMPLNMLSHFIKDGNLTFRFNIIRNQPAFKSQDKNSGQTNENKQVNKGPKGQQQKGGPNSGNPSRTKSPSAIHSHQKGPGGFNPNNKGHGKKQNKN